MRKAIIVCTIIAAVALSANAAPIAGTYNIEGNWNEAFNGWDPLPRPGDVGNNILYAGGNGWYAYGTLASVELISSSENSFVYRSVYAGETGYANINLNYGGPWSPGNAINYQAYIGEITVITTKTYDGTPMQDESNLIGLSFVASGSGNIISEYPQGNASAVTPVEGVTVSFYATSSQMPVFGYWEPDVLMDMSGEFDSVQVTIIPEPATMSLLAIGALALIRRK